MPWAAAAIVGSAVIGASASRKAAKAGEKGTEEAAQVERERLAEDKKRYAEMAPYRKAGLESVDWLRGVMGSPGVPRIDPSKELESDPGYQFRLGQGQTFLDRFQAASGHRLGGRAIKEGIRYNQDFGSNEYGKIVDRRFRLAGFSGSSTPAPTSILPQIALAAGQNQANLYNNYNNTAQNALQNYQTYRTYQDWQKQYNTEPVTYTT